jgi:hypothetical protein
VTSLRYWIRMSRKRCWPRAETSGGTTCRLAMPCNSSSCTTARYTSRSLGTSRHTLRQRMGREACVTCATPIVRVTKVKVSALCWSPPSPCEHPYSNSHLSYGWVARSRTCKWHFNTRVKQRKPDQNKQTRQPCCPLMDHTHAPPANWSSTMRAFGLSIYTSDIFFFLHV